MMAVLAWGGEARKRVVERPLMGTKFQVVVWAEAGEKEVEDAVMEAFRVAKGIEKVASDYDPESELMKLGMEEKEVSEELAAVLFPALDLARETRGAFDPTIGPLSRLWRETRRLGRLPEAGVLEKARERVGWRQVVYDPATRRLRLGREGMSLDLGGIAKGYAADRMVEVLAGRGLTSVCVAAGGDVRVGAPPPGKKAWVVGLKTFDLKQPEERLELADAAVSTSGDLHQHVEIEGVRYSHVIDPATGLGMTRRVAASVVAARGVVSDPLSKAACLGLPDEELKRLGALRVIRRGE